MQQANAGNAVHAAIYYRLFSLTNISYKQHWVCLFTVNGRGIRHAVYVPHPMFYLDQYHLQQIGDYLHEHNKNQSEEKHHRQHHGRDRDCNGAQKQHQNTNKHQGDVHLYRNHDVKLILIL